MKNSKGITLISVTIYVISMLITVAVLTVASNFFYNNVIAQKGIGKIAAQITRFNMYFIEDAKTSSEVNINSETQLTFSNGSVYTFSKSANSNLGVIYRDKIKICENVSECYFANLGDLSKVEVKITFKESANSEELNQTYKIGRGY